MQKFKFRATLCRLFIFEQERHLWVSLSIKFIMQLWPREAKDKNWWEFNIKMWDSDPHQIVL